MFLFAVFLYEIYKKNFLSIFLKLKIKISFRVRKYITYFLLLHTTKNKKRNKLKGINEIFIIFIVFNIKYNSDFIPFVCLQYRFF